MRGNFTIRGAVDPLPLLHANVQDPGWLHLGGAVQFGARGVRAGAPASPAHHVPRGE